MKDEVHECGKGGHESGWSVRYGYGEQEKLATVDLLWRPLMGAAKRKRRFLTNIIVFIYLLLLSHNLYLNSMQLNIQKWLPDPNVTMYLFCKADICIQA